jgi:hypothetical protein
MNPPLVAAALAAVLVVIGLCAYVLGAHHAAAALWPCRCTCHTHKRRLKLMLELKPGGSFPLSVLTDPPNTRLDTGDVAPAWRSSDEAVATVVPDPSNPLTATVTAVAPGDFVISVAEADADLDSGETRLLGAEFLGRVVAPEAEAQSISLVAGAVTYPTAAPAEPPAGE